MSVILLERGMTAAAFDDYLAASSETSQLAGKLGAGVDGDLLIKIIARAGKADPLPLKPFFEDAHIGPLGNLALLIDSFVKVEKQQAKNAGSRFLEMWAMRNLPFVVSIDTPTSHTDS